MEVNSQVHVPTALPTGKQHQAPIRQEAGWAVEQVWTFGKKKCILPMSEIESHIFKSTALSLLSLSLYRLHYDDHYFIIITITIIK